MVLTPVVPCEYASGASESPLAQLAVRDAFSRCAMDNQLEHPSLALGVYLDGRARVRVALIAPQQEVACMYTHTQTDNNRGPPLVVVILISHNSTSHTHKTNDDATTRLNAYINRERLHFDALMARARTWLPRYWHNNVLVEGCGRDGLQVIVKLTHLSWPERCLHYIIELVLTLLRVHALEVVKGESLRPQHLLTCPLINRPALPLAFVFLPIFSPPMRVANPPRSRDILYAYMQTTTFRTCTHTS